MSSVVRLAAKSVAELSKDLFWLERYYREDGMLEDATRVSWLKIDVDSQLREAGVVPFDGSAFPPPFAGTTRGQ